MSAIDTAERFSPRALSAMPKRSSRVALALMGTASFAASFAAGSMFLNWKSPVPTAAAATQQQACTKNPDGTQNCQRSNSGWRSRVYYYIPWSSGSNTSSTTTSGSSSAKFSDTDTPAKRASDPGGVKRSGFGSVARSVASGHASAGG